MERVDTTCSDARATNSVTGDAADAKTPVSEPPRDGLRFEDPYWDDAYCTWLDNGLRTCCG